MKKRKCFFTLSLLLLYFALKAQVLLPNYTDSLFPAYYHQRVSLFNSLPVTNNDVVFIGNSITDGSEWGELFNDLHIKNRGISGDITAGVIKRIDEVARRKPSKIFLMIGINDLSRGVTADSVVKNILLIAAYLRQQTVTTQVFIQSILPINNSLRKFTSHISNGMKIRQVNDSLKINAAAYHYTFVNLYTSFCDKDEKLNLRYTNDGLHLKGEGYILWKHLVYSYVYGLQQKPSLIPLPQNLQWNDEKFPLYACKTILITNQSLYKEALLLQQLLQSKGLDMNITGTLTNEEPLIELNLGKVNATVNEKEAYQLTVTGRKITINAITQHGIFNAIQTLRQLMRDDAMMDGCVITDWPAFSWRGYMIDVGRNYMSLSLLKQQIDAMAAAKLNIFHFHATEDIAWRIAIKQYPQLTAPENMLRNKGMYYTEAEIKELIAYCKERQITFVPEIDMPGHSAAFKRAMKTDMQSDSGLLIVKNILKEFCTTYDVPYIHIGADEVKITNKNFVPEITSYIESLGKKVIGWQPGGNFNNSTIRQLWMDDNAHLSSNSNIQFIDSRHLYLNHMDPLEAVTTIFNRRIGDKEQGDASLLGGTICMWHDRAVANEEDVLRMNPVYPGILAFAERSWRGGGKQGWIANISDGDVKAFKDFENRLLDIKQLYFTGKSFPYTKQAGFIWKLYGPFDNNGEVDKKFSPETKSFDEIKEPVYKEVTGGTVVLHHWWAPLIKGAIDNAKENTTCYATTKIWADEAGEKNFWIGFNNLSRSPATDSPPKDAWDAKGSAVWVNGKLIASPHWLHAGQKGNSEIPLADEGYEYREPTKIYLQKGWNNVLIKAPITSFKGKDWQNPVKWEFTFIKL